MARSRYVHALGWRSLNRLYDPFLRLTMRERRFKQRLIERADVKPGDWVLDLGCGTGTLLLMLHRSQPEARLVGVDGDDTILQIARDKASRAGTVLTLAAADAAQLPFRGGIVDRVLTTLVLHHLQRDHKKRVLREISRVLRPGGELHIADWGRPHTRLMSIASQSVAAFDGRQVVADNLAGRLPQFCREAGFDEVSEDERWPTLFGTLAFVRATKRAI